MTLFHISVINKITPMLIWSPNVLSCFRVNQYLLLYAADLAEKYCWFTRSGFEPMTYHTRSEHAYHLITNAVFVIISAEHVPGCKDVMTFANWSPKHMLISNWGYLWTMTNNIIKLSCCYTLRVSEYVRYCTTENIKYIITK